MYVVNLKVFLDMYLPRDRNVIVAMWQINIWLNEFIFFEFDED